MLFRSQCIQKTANKSIVSEKDIIQSNKNGMGNQVGTITNRITGMIDLLARFNKNSNEYKELSYRILCGQNFQQNELDKIKGIISNPMPKYWYEHTACEDDFEQNICANKKPYFMIYIYPELKKRYKDYIIKFNTQAQSLFNKNLKDILSQPILNDKEKDFVFYYRKNIPVNISNSTMNKICFHIEDEFRGYVCKLKQDNNFDYTFMKSGRKCFNEHRQQIEQIYQEYLLETKSFKHNKAYKRYDKDEIVGAMELFKDEFKERIFNLGYSDEEVLDIVLDVCYSNNRSKQFCWDVVGDKIIDRIRGEKNTYIE